VKDPTLICDLIRETAYDIHNFLSYGHLEKVCENALLNRLRKQGVSVQQQYPLSVHDEDSTELGHYFADLIVENRLLVELKACKSLCPEYTAQLLGYLRATGIEYGLLINFGAPKFEIRKYVLSDIDRESHSSLTS
jgi:GxxExxY protein